MAPYPPHDGTFWKGPVQESSTTPWRAGSDILLAYLFVPKDSLKPQTRKAKPPKKEAVAAKTRETEAVAAAADTYFAYSPRAKPAPLNKAAFVLDLAEHHGHVGIRQVTDSQTYMPEYFLRKNLR